MLELPPQFWQIVFLTGFVSGIAVCLATMLGIPLGVWLGWVKFPGRGLAIALIHTGMAMPPVVAGLVAYLLLSRSGPLGEAGWLFTPQAMILVQFALALPFVAGITCAAVESLPRDLPGQIRLLGATPWQVRGCLLREARSGIAVAVAAAWGRSLSEVGAVLLVGGNIAGHTRVLTTAILLETQQGQFSAALALGGCLLVLALVTNLVAVRYFGRLSVR